MWGASTVVCIVLQGVWTTYSSIVGEGEVQEHCFARHDSSAKCTEHERNASMRLTLNRPRCCDSSLGRCCLRAAVERQHSNIDVEPRRLFGELRRRGAEEARREESRRDEKNERRENAGESPQSLTTPKFSNNCQAIQHSPHEPSPCWSWLPLTAEPRFVALPARASLRS